MWVIKKYISNNWVSIIDNIASINTDAWPYFLENDAFFSSIISYIRVTSPETPIVIQLIGDPENQEQVRDKLQKNISTLQFGYSDIITIRSTPIEIEPINDTTPCVIVDSGICSVVVPTEDRLKEDLTTIKVTNKRRKK